MHIVVVGLNHRTAPIALRERVAFSDQQAGQGLIELKESYGSPESVIVSTCNRTEIYSHQPAGFASDQIRRFLLEKSNLDERDLLSHLYEFTGIQAVQHLFRVASGLDSLVLGEPQILRQIRDAYSLSEKANTIGPTLHSLFRNALFTGKRARTETQIGSGGFSVGHAAVELSSSIFGSLGGSKVLVLGAGKMSEVTAKHLVSKGVSLVMVANRTFDRAQSLASRLGGQAIHYDDFPEALVTSDVVISSTAAPGYVLHDSDIRPAMKKRRGRPLFLIDLAVPRDIDPVVREMENVFLYDVDDLQAVVYNMARERAQDTALVQEIIDEEATKFEKWNKSLSVGPIVAQLKSRQEEIRQSELQRLRNQLPDVDAYAWQKIEAASLSMMNRQLKPAIDTIRRYAESEEVLSAAELIAAASTLFQIEPIPDAPAPEEEIR